VVDSGLGKARHQFVNNFLDKQVRHAGTAALGELKRCTQVDNIGGISVSIVVVAAVLMSLIARYLKIHTRALS
jgi:hypothetical protein